MHDANDAKTFLKHFSDCLFYFCSTCADSIMWMELFESYLNCLRFINAALEIQQRRAEGALQHSDDPTLDACSHPAFPFEIPPPATAKQQSKKQQASNGTDSDTVKLTLAQWHALVSFWEHRLFVRARYVGLLFGFAAVIVGTVSVVNNHWTTFHSKLIFFLTYLIMYWFT